MERSCVEEVVRAVTKRSGLDFGTVLHVLSALGVVRAATAVACVSTGRLHTRPGLVEA